jgi:hypothetical protein
MLEMVMAAFLQHIYSYLNTFHKSSTSQPNLRMFGLYMSPIIICPRPALSLSNRMFASRYRTIDSTKSWNTLRMYCFHMPIKIFAESEGFYWTVGAPEGGFVCCFDVVTMIFRLGQFIDLQEIQKTHFRSQARGKVLGQEGHAKESGFDVFVRKDGGVSGTSMKSSMGKSGTDWGSDEEAKSPYSEGGGGREA